MATTIADQITLDGTFADWPADDMIMTPENTVSGYQVYGGLFDDQTLGETYVIGIDSTGSNPAIGPYTFIYLNTDQNDTTGYDPFGDPVGAEYYIEFSLNSENVLEPYLYSVTSAGTPTLLNDGAPLDYGISTNGESVEVAIPQTLLTPDNGVAGGPAPTTIDFDVLLNNATPLPSVFATTTPEYVIPDAAAAPPTTIANTITLNGTFTDWPASDMIMTPGNTVAGYQVYGAFLDDATLGNTYVIGIDATNAADPVIGVNTTIFLNTDQNTATGYELSYANVGAKYEVVFQYGSNSELEPFLYSLTSAGTPTELNGDAPLDYGFSSNGESVELAIPQSLLTPDNGTAGGPAPTSINFDVLVNNSEGLPTDFNSDEQYTITDPATLVPVNSEVKKVGIVFSATTEALYFGGGPAGESAYADLFMDAQQQARAAGVSYSLLTEADLTNAAELSQYSALIFPDFQDVQSSQVAAIDNALNEVVYDYHVPIITAGDFMTNDQNGNPLPGNPYASMENLLNLTQSGYGTATYSVTPDPTALASNNPILAGYTSGQLLGGASGIFPGTTQGYYTETGYTTFAGVTQTANTIADINVQGDSTPLAGVVQTTTGGTNTDFATTGLFGDSNLLQHVIQNTVFGTTPSLAIDITRFNGILNSRTDMDQSQFPTDVDPVLYDDQPAGTPGIYDELIPILQKLQQQYDFVGSYYINIGDDANPENDNFTNWSISTPYYDEILQMGNEIGDHSYTHLIDPPTTTTPETTTSDTPPGSTEVTVSSLPSYNGATLGMVVTDPTNSAAIGPNTIISAVSGNATTGYTLTLTYQPGGYGTANLGVQEDIPDGSTLDFGVPNENTNFLSTTGTGPFTYDYEFGKSQQIEDQNIGITIAGAAVPGANDYLPDSQQILSYFPDNTADGLTGYVSGGWTGAGSGSPNAFGYLTPGDTESVYIAPNITFDFSEIQYENKSPQSGLADWESLFNQLSANSETPIIVWPWHDYGITDWPTDGVGTTPPGYTEGLYQDFIAYAYNAGYEFVTTEDLAQRIAAEQAATISESTSTNASGNAVITAIVTPGTSGQDEDLGTMAVNVTNGNGQVIENAGSWYAYNTKSVFLADDAANNGAPETFVVTLGATQDDVTHIDYLPMRADLQSVTGNGSNLTFSMTGDGTVDIDIKTPGSATNVISVQTSAVGTGAGAPTASLVGNALDLTFVDGPLAISSTSPQGVPVLHDVTITEGASAVAGATFVFTAPVVAISNAGGFTDQVSQTISGTVTEPVESQVVGTTVTLYDNGSTVALGTATVSSTGSWTTTVTLSGDGTHTIVAKDTDLAGLLGESSAVVYTLDTIPPTVTISSAGGATNNPIQTISGTVTAATGEAPVGTTVTLYDNGSTTALGTATVQAGGSWSTTVTLPAEGTHSIVAEDTDAAGNIGSSAAVVYTVDTPSPAVLIASAGGQTNNPSQTISGMVSEPAETAVAGTTVTLYDNGSATALATATVSSTGTWSTTVTLSPDGTHSIVASDTDLAGNTGSSGAVSYTLDTQTPAVAITSAGGVTANPSQTISGAVTEPVETEVVGTTVTLYDNGSTAALGTATVGANGSWTTTVSLIEGVNSVVATDTDLAGNPGSSSAVSYTLDTQAPTVLIASAGGQTNRPSQTITGTVTELAETNVAGTTVTLYDDGSTTALGTATVSSTGTWSTTVTLSGDGAHSIVATDTDLAGHTGTSSAVAYTLDTQTPAVAITSAGGQTNNSLQTISGAVTEPVETEVVGSTVTLYDDGSTTALGTATVGANGSWTTTVMLTGDGTHSIVASDTDLASNSGSSSAVSYTLDTQTPAIAITSAGGQTNNPLQTISGAVTEPVETEVVGSTVTLYDNGSTTALGTATVGANGSWTTTVTLSGDGTHSITATDTDLAGNPGSSSAVSYTLDTQTPTVAITSAGSATDNPVQTISGMVTEPVETEVAGTTVTLYDNGSTTALGTATVQANGSWSTTVTLSAEGTHSIVAEDTDAAGNIGSSAPPVIYTVETSPPTVAIASAGGQTNNPDQTISGAVTEPAETAVAGTTVTLYDNGSTTALGTATVGANGSWSTSVSLIQGVNSIVATDTDLAGNAGSSSAVSYTVDTQTPVVAIGATGGQTNNPMQTFSGTVTEPVETEVAGTTVTLYDNGTMLTTATVLSTGTWSASVTLSGDGTHSIVASDTDLAGNTGASSTVVYTLDTQTPVVAITSAGGVTPNPSQAISGTVTEPVESEVVGTTVTLYDNGATTALGTATVQANGSWSTTVTLSAGSNSIVAKDTDLADNTGSSSAVSYTLETAPTITSATYTGSETTGDWSLSGTAAAGSTVTVYNGATLLGSTTATGGVWTFKTTLNDTAIRVFTVTETLSGITSAASAPYYEGTPGNDVFDFASEAAVSAAALINGGAGTNTLQMTSPWTMSDADFAHIEAIQTLGLNGASGVTLGPDAAAAGVNTVVTGAGATSVTDTNSGALTINAAALGAGNLLTLAGSAPMTVTNLTGNLNAAADTGALTVTATGTAAQSIATGSGATSIADSATGGSVVIDATALGTNTLTLSGSAAKTVNNLAGNLVVSGAATIILTAIGSGAQSVTTGTGNTSITENGSGLMTVNANATGSGKTLTLSGNGSVSVINLAENIVATGFSGSLTVTTKTSALSIATGTGQTTVNAGAMTGALTLTGSSAATVTALGGNLTATNDSGALTVTTTGGTQTVTTGSGSIAITDDSTGTLTVNAAALGSGGTLTLTGAGAVTVTNLKGSLVATGDTGAVTVTATGAAAQSVITGSGATSIADSTTGGSVVVNATALGTSTLTLSGSAAKTVTNSAGSLVVTGSATVSATSSGSQSVTTSTGAVTITDNSSSMTVNAGTGTLTLNGGAANTATVIAAGNVNATGDSGALTVTATGAAAQTVTTGSNNISITDSKSAGTLTVNDTAQGAGNTLTLMGAGAVTVTNLKGILNATGDSGPLTVTAAAGTTALNITTGSGATSITDSSTASGASVTVSATALGTSTLTLAGSVAKTVTNSAGSLVVTGSATVSATSSGSQSVTTSTGAVTITDNSSSMTINAGTGALTLIGANPATVIAAGNVNATGDSGALTVTTTGATQTVTTGSGNIAITDDSTGTLTVNAAALGSGGTLTLTGPGAATVTNLKGSLVATGDTGAVTVTATGAAAQSVTTGSGATSIADSTTGGSVVVNATALGTNTLTLSGSAAKTVTNSAGSLVVTGSATVSATSSGSQSVTTSTGAVTITDNSSSLTVNAGTGALTLIGANPATVIAAGNVTATGDSGVLTVTATGAAAQTVTTGSNNISIADSKSAGTLTVNDTAQGSGDTLTLTGAGAVTVTNLKGSLNATGDSGPLTVTATGTAAQSVATGSGAMSIADSASGSSVTISAAAMLGTNTLTLSGSAAETVNSLTGNLAATGDTGALTVTATGTGPQTIQTGTGKDTINVTSSTGGDTITGSAGESISLASHLAADTFTYAKTSASPNTSAGHDTITGFSPSTLDLLNFSTLSASLKIEGQVSSGSTVAADSIAWLYSGGNAMVYVNDSASALSTTSTSASFMEITLAGVSSGLSASNFRA